MRYCGIDVGAATRPLVVVTEQDVSLADGFNLEKSLRDAPDEVVQRCLAFPREAGTLDDVFSAARAHDTVRGV